MFYVLNSLKSAPDLFGSLMQKYPGPYFMTQYPLVFVSAISTASPQVHKSTM